MAKKKELPLFEKITVTDAAAGGKGVARAGDLVIFIPGTVPGDVIDIQVTLRKRNYLEGTPVMFHEYSPDRTNPECMHFGVCGGCTWQNLQYRKQLFYKGKIVRDSLERIGGIEISGIRPLLSSPQEYYYRNKLEYTFSSKKWLSGEEMKMQVLSQCSGALGFHKPGFFDRVIDIYECRLQAEPTNLIRNAVREYAKERTLSFYNIREHTGLLRNLVIRNTSDGEVMVIVVFGERDDDRIAALLDFLRKEFPSITSLMYVINMKKNDTILDQEVLLHSGKEYITETMNGIQFRIGPKSFYQTNTLQAVRLYDTVKQMAALTGRENVYDLYSGTGTIACYLASGCARVTGLEYVREAVEDAKTNAAINGIDNASFIAGDIKDLLEEGLFERNGMPDVIITDPPRSGMHKDVVKAILNATPHRIVYVSCNPATQARDIALLSEKYFPEQIQPVDMFPQTFHVENVVLLVRKSES